MLNVKKTLTKLIEIIEIKEETITVTGSDWTLYTVDEPLSIRRQAGVVTLSGALKNTATKTLKTTGEVVFNIPEGYRPRKIVHALCQYSNGRYYATISPTGDVTFARAASSGTTYPSNPSGQWWPLSITFVL